MRILEYNNISILEYAHARISVTEIKKAIGFFDCDYESDWIFKTRMSVTAIMKAIGNLELDFAKL